MEVPYTLMLPRCILLLQNATKSEATFKTYMYNLKRFKEFFKIEDYDSLIKIESSKINEMIEDWLIHLRETVSPNSLPTMYYGIELFFAMNDVTINSKKLRRMFPSKVKRTGDKPYTTEQIRDMLSVTRYKRDKAFIHFLASTGTRVGAIKGLECRHIEKMSDNCKSVLFYENTNDEYYAFLTPEASKALDEYLEQRAGDGERLGPNSPVFRTVYADGLNAPKPFSVSGSKNIIYRALKQARISRTKSGNAYDIQLDMGFRKRFNTILKLNSDVNSNIAEKLMAHKRGLDGVYFKPTRGQCFEEFRKAIQDLTVDPTERQKIKIEKLEEEKSKLEEKTAESAKMKKQLEHDHVLVQVLAKTMKEIGINFEYPDGTPYEIDENLKIPKEYLPKQVKLDESLKDLNQEIMIT